MLPNGFLLGLKLALRRGLVIEGSGQQPFCPTTAITNTSEPFARNVSPTSRRGRRRLAVCLAVPLMGALCSWFPSAVLASNGPLKQTIGAFSFNPTSLIVGMTITVSATGGASGNPVLFSSTTPSTCTISSNIITGVSAGTCAVSATQAGNANYSAATRNWNIVVASKPQTIGTFAFNPALLLVGNTTTVSATGGASGNPVVFSSTTPNTCTVSGNTITGVSAGTCTVSANQTGNANYSAATRNWNIAVAMGAQVISAFSFNPAPLTVGTTTTVSASGGASGNPLLFSATTPGTCTVSGNTITGVATGTCTVSASQAGNANYSAASRNWNIAVTKGSQTIGTITFSPTPLLVHGSTTAQASATSGLATTFASSTLSTCTVSGNHITGIAAGTCIITASQTGNANYRAAPQVTQSIPVVTGSITKTAQTIGVISVAPVHTWNLATDFSTVSNNNAGVSPWVLGEIVSGTFTPYTTYTPGTTNAWWSLGSTSGGSGFIGLYSVTDYGIQTGNISLEADWGNPDARWVAPNTGTYALTVAIGGSTAQFQNGFGNADASLAGLKIGGVAQSANSFNNNIKTWNLSSVALNQGQTVDAYVGQGYGGGNTNTVFTVTGPDVPSSGPPVLVIGNALTLGAVATSGLPVSFSSTTPTICTVSGVNGSTVTGVAVGTCTITASQVGDNSYDSAPPVTQNITVTIVGSQLFGANLLVNGDAESGTGSADGSVVSTPGWTTNGNFTVLQYGAGGGFPLATDPGPANRGVNFFAGGPNNAASSATQLVDVSAGGATIDGGKVAFKLAGYLGGWSSQDDNATLTATFLSANNATLGTATIGPVMAADRNNATGLLYRSASGALPVGTRSVSFTLQTNRLAGSYNDGYADNLSFVLSAYTTVSLPTVNTDLRTWTNGTAYSALFSGVQNLGGVPFALQLDAGGHNAFEAWVGAGPLDITVGTFGVSTVYTLINSAMGTLGANVGSLTFNGSAGASYTVNLVEGTNIRDHYFGSYVNSITDTSVAQAVVGVNSAGHAHLDRQAFTLPDAFKTQTLTDIVFSNAGTNSYGIPFLAGVTVQ